MDRIRPGVLFPPASKSTATADSHFVARNPGVDRQHDGLVRGPVQRVGLRRRQVALDEPLRVLALRRALLVARRSRLVVGHLVDEQRVRGGGAGCGPRPAGNGGDWRGAGPRCARP